MAAWIWRPTRSGCPGLVGRVPRNEKAPATWTVLELKSIPPFGRAGVVACPTPLAPLPIFSAQTWPHGALRVASGSFCCLTDGCQPVSFRQVPTCRRIRSDQIWANQRHRAFSAGMEELASIPDAGGQLPAASLCQKLAKRAKLPRAGLGVSNREIAK
jgi:hypothetical protein